MNGDDGNVREAERLPRGDYAAARLALLMMRGALATRRQSSAAAPVTIASVRYDSMQAAAGALMQVAKPIRCSASVRSGQLTIDYRVLRDDPEEYAVHRRILALRQRHGGAFPLPSGESGSKADLALVYFAGCEEDLIATRADAEGCMRDYEPHPMNAAVVTPEHCRTTDPALWAAVAASGASLVVRCYTRDAGPEGTVIPFP